MKLLVLFAECKNFRAARRAGPVARLRIERSNQSKIIRVLHFRTSKNRSSTPGQRPVSKPSP
jgi:hypothetical protein